MQFQFSPLFRLSFIHGFYTDKSCNAFQVKATADTAALLSRHQMIWRQNGSSFSVLFRSKSEADLTHAALPLGTGDALFFVMKLTYPEFYNFTNELPARGKSFLFTNNIVFDSSVTNELERTEVTISGLSIAYTVPKDKALTVTLTDQKTVPATWYSQKHAASDKGDREFTIDLPAGTTGLFTLTITGDLTPDPEHFYVDPGLQFDRPFGLIRLVNDAPDPLTYDGNRLYSVSFTPKSCNWNYYVVVNSNYDPALLTVEDKSTIVIADQVVFNPVTGTELDDDKVPGLITSNRDSVALFRSAVSLPYQQKPRPKFALLKSGSIIINDLPNPDVSKPDANMFIYV